MVNQKEFLNQMKKAVLSFDDRAEIILFGSRARGDFKEDSDWDVLVLTDSVVDFNYRSYLVESLFALELEHGQAISPLIVERTKWNDWEIMPLHKNVLKEGIAV